MSLASDKPRGFWCRPQSSQKAWKWEVNIYYSVFTALFPTKQDKNSKRKIFQTKTLYPTFSGLNFVLSKFLSSSWCDCTWGLLQGIIKGKWGPNLIEWFPNFPRKRKCDHIEERPGIGVQKDHFQARGLWRQLGLSFSSPGCSKVIVAF